MALKVLQSQVTSLGQFDALDADLPNFKGGEVVTLTGVTYAGADKAAADELDGYTGTTSKTRPAVTYQLGTGAGGPYWLADDGTTYYGTLFGSVVGGSTGQQVTGGTALGPHTATGSGKITCWTQPGLYGVTLDACDSSLAPTTPIAVGAALTASATTGRLGTSLTANAGATMARFVEFATDGSLVTSKPDLVTALNSPVSEVSSAKQKQFLMAVFHWNG